MQYRLGVRLACTSHNPPVSGPQWYHITGVYCHIRCWFDLKQRSMSGWEMGHYAQVGLSGVKGTCSLGLSCSYSDGDRPQYRFECAESSLEYHGYCDQKDLEPDAYSQKCLLVSFFFYRWLKTPLETLSVIDCNLSKSDWFHISEFQCTSQLKHLNLKWVKLTHLSPEPLRVLLLKSASTLTSLDLEGCQMMDSQLSAILPALRCCTQLTKFNFHGNYISMPILRELAYNVVKQKSQQSKIRFIPSCSHHSGLEFEAISQPHIVFVDVDRTTGEQEQVLFYAICSGEYVL